MKRTFIIVLYVMAISCFTGQVKEKRSKKYPNIFLRNYDRKPLPMTTLFSYQNFSLIRIIDTAGNVQEISMQMEGDSCLTIKGDTLLLIKKAMIFMKDYLDRTQEAFRGSVIIAGKDTFSVYPGDTTRIESTERLKKKLLLPQRANYKL